MESAGPVRVLEGRYRLGVVVGSGGMGTVWQARDELLNREVAVKEIVWPPYFDDAEREAARRRAVREAQVAARLRHPNVVGIYDIIEEDGRPWIVMELLPYRSLHDIVREDGPLAPVQAARVGLGILAALCAAHADGIVHRDVKPANILVGPDGRAVLTDFGIARAAGGPAVTNSGVLLGSPSYIAPERARGGQADAAGDLWGLGASLYTAVEGRPPFDRNGALASLTAVVADEPDPAVRAGPLRPVISGLLRKDPGKRLDAAATKRMLRKVVADGEARRAIAAPPRAQPWESGEPTAPLAWRSRVAPGAPAAAVAVVAAAATALAFVMGDAQRHPAALTGNPHGIRPSATASPHSGVRPVSAGTSRTPASPAGKPAPPASAAAAGPGAKAAQDAGRGTLRAMYDRATSPARLPRPHPGPLWHPPSPGPHPGGPPRHLPGPPRPHHAPGHHLALRGHGHGE